MAVEGYKTQEFHGPVKRFCRTMDLKDDAALITEYIMRHSEEEAWPEIRAGIRSVGILEMEIYILDNRLFMIIETPMSIFQQCNEGDTAEDKWKMMSRIFHLYK